MYMYVYVCICMYMYVYVCLYVFIYLLIDYLDVQPHEAQAYTVSLCGPPRLCEYANIYSLANSNKN